MILRIKTLLYHSHHFSTAMKCWRLILILKQNQYENQGFHFYFATKCQWMLLKVFWFLWILVNGVDKFSLIVFPPALFTGTCCITWEKRLHIPEKNMQKQSLRLFCLPHSKSPGLVTKSQVPSIKQTLTKTETQTMVWQGFFEKKLNMLPNSNINDKMSLCSQFLRHWSLHTHPQ